MPDQRRDICPENEVHPLRGASQSARFLLSSGACFGKIGDVQLRRFEPSFPAED
jgi:hypothetical protein